MRSLKQQLRCHASDLLGVVACVLGRPAVSAPTHFDALQYVIGIAVRIRPKISSGRNMDYFHFASDLELLACHRCHGHHSPPSAIASSTDAELPQQRRRSTYTSLVVKTVQNCSHRKTRAVHIQILICG